MTGLASETPNGTQFHFENELLSNHKVIIAVLCGEICVKVLSE